MGPRCEFVTNCRRFIFFIYQANPPVALSNYSYPMFTTEYLENRVDGLIEKQEKDALALYERIRDKHLRSEFNPASKSWNMKPESEESVSE